MEAYFKKKQEQESNWKQNNYSLEFLFSLFSEEKYGNF